VTRWTRQPHLARRHGCGRRGGLCKLRVPEAAVDRWPRRPVWSQLQAGDRAELLLQRHAQVGLAAHGTLATKTRRPGEEAAATSSTHRARAQVDLALDGLAIERECISISSAQTSANTARDLCVVGGEVQEPAGEVRDATYTALVATYIAQPT